MSEINQYFLDSYPASQSSKSLVDLISKLNLGKARDHNGDLTKTFQKPAILCIGPDTLNLKNTNPEKEKPPVEKVTPDQVEPAKKEIKDKDLTDMNITQEDFDTLNAPFQDPAKIANIIKKIASSQKPEKVAEKLNKLFEHLPEKSREAIF